MGLQFPHLIHSFGIVFDFAKRIKQFVAITSPKSQAESAEDGLLAFDGRGPEEHPQCFFGMSNSWNKPSRPLFVTA